MAVSVGVLLSVGVAGSTVGVAVGVLVSQRPQEVSVGGVPFSVDVAVKVNVGKPGKIGDGVRVAQGGT